jgi:hypothetical protein
MRFSLRQKRATIGHTITVRVTASSREEIKRVSISLDGRKLATEILSPPEVQFECVFNQVGGAGPGRDHVLVVRATNTEGDTQVASHRWNDVA